jgi:hypothetical protein
MKISTVITAVALAFGGAAFAQSGAGASDHNSGTTATSQQSTANGGGIIDKTKRGLHRMGAKVRNALHRDHTTSMGAAGNDNTAQDAGRRGRMDDAYANWKAKHAK